MAAGALGAMFDRLPPDGEFIDRVIRSIVLPAVVSEITGDGASLYPDEN